jgi:hypothetical protein
MSSQSDRDIFRRNNPHLSERMADEAWRRGGALPRIELDDGRELTWKDIEAVTGGLLGKVTMPCPYCGPDKPWSQRFQIDRKSYATAAYHCFYCGHGGQVHAEGPIDPAKEAAARKAAAILKRERQAERSAAAIRWWDEALSITKIITVQKYFAARAISELPPNIDEVFRWHPDCPFDGSKRGVLLALFRDAISGEPRAIHRTWIRDPRRGLATRMSLGPIAGAAIQLWPISGDRLAICEGIENALSVASYSYEGEPTKPVWSATVANNLGALPVIPGINRLFIFADQGLAGETQANVMAARWRSAGREVRVIYPKREGEDWNDIAKRKLKNA